MFALHSVVFDDFDFVLAIMPVLIRKYMSQKGNAELGVLATLAAGVAAIAWKAGLLVGLSAVASGCAGFKIYAGMERVDKVVTKQVTKDESFLCKMGYCDKSVKDEDESED